MKGKGTDYKGSSTHHKSSLASKTGAIRKQPYRGNSHPKFKRQNKRLQKKDGNIDNVDDDEEEEGDDNDETMVDDESIDEGEFDINSEEQLKLEKDEYRQLHESLSPVERSTAGYVSIAKLDENTNLNAGISSVTGEPTKFILTGQKSNQANVDDNLNTTTGGRKAPRNIIIHSKIKNIDKMLIRPASNNSNPITPSSMNDGGSNEYSSFSSYINRNNGTFDDITYPLGSPISGPKSITVTREKRVSISNVPVSITNIESRTEGDAHFVWNIKDNTVFRPKNNTKKKDFYITNPNTSAKDKEKEKEKDSNDESRKYIKITSSGTPFSILKNSSLLLSQRENERNEKENKKIQDLSLVASAATISSSLYHPPSAATTSGSLTSPFIKLSLNTNDPINATSASTTTTTKTDVNSTVTKPSNSLVDVLTSPSDRGFQGFSNIINTKKLSTLRSATLNTLVDSYALATGKSTAINPTLNRKVLLDSSINSRNSGNMNSYTTGNTNAMLSLNTPASTSTSASESDIGMRTSVFICGIPVTTTVSYVIANLFKSLDTHGIIRVKRQVSKATDAQPQKAVFEIIVGTPYHAAGIVSNFDKLMFQGNELNAFIVENDDSSAETVENTTTNTPTTTNTNTNTNSITSTPSTATTVATATTATTTTTQPPKDDVNWFASISSNSQNATLSSSSFFQKAAQSHPHPQSQSRMDETSDSYGSLASTMLKFVRDQSDQTSNTFYRPNTKDTTLDQKFSISSGVSSAPTAQQHPLTTTTTAPITVTKKISVVKKSGQTTGGKNIATGSKIITVSGKTITTTGPKVIMIKKPVTVVSTPPVNNIIDGSSVTPVASVASVTTTVPASTSSTSSSTPLTDTHTHMNDQSSGVDSSITTSSTYPTEVPEKSDRSDRSDRDIHDSRDYERDSRNTRSRDYDRDSHSSRSRDYGSDRDRDRDRDSRDYDRARGRDYDRSDRDYGRDRDYDKYDRYDRYDKQSKSSSEVAAVSTPTPTLSTNIENPLDQSQSQSHDVSYQSYSTKDRERDRDRERDSYSSGSRDSYNRERDLYSSRDRDSYNRDPYTSSSRDSYSNSSRDSYSSSSRDKDRDRTSRYNRPDSRYNPDQSTASLSPVAAITSTVSSTNVSTSTATAGTTDATTDSTDQYYHDDNTSIESSYGSYDTNMNADVSVVSGVDDNSYGDGSGDTSTYNYQDSGTDQYTTPVSTSTSSANTNDSYSTYDTSYDQKYSSYDYQTSHTRDRDSGRDSGRDSRDSRDSRNVSRDQRSERSDRGTYDSRSNDYYNTRDSRYKDSRDSGRDFRDSRDNRDSGRDFRESRDNRDGRDMRDNRDNRDSRDSRDTISRDSRYKDSRDSRYKDSTRDSKDIDGTDVYSKSSRSKISAIPTTVPSIGVKYNQYGQPIMDTSSSQSQYGSSSSSSSSSSGSGYNTHNLYTNSTVPPKAPEISPTSASISTAATTTTTTNPKAKTSLVFGKAAALNKPKPKAIIPVFAPAGMNLQKTSSMVSPSQHSHILSSLLPNSQSQSFAHSVNALQAKKSYEIADTKTVSMSMSTQSTSEIDTRGNDNDLTITSAVTHGGDNTTTQENNNVAYDDDQDDYYEEEGY